MSENYSSVYSLQLFDSCSDAQQLQAGFGTSVLAVAFVCCFDTYGVWNAGRPNMVYFNRGDGTFVDSGQRMGNLNSFAVTLADLDDDGDIDAFVANGAYSGGNPNKIWLNDGTGRFTDSGQNLGHNNTGAVALTDLDGDGDLDVAVVYPNAAQIFTNFLIHIED